MEKKEESKINVSFSSGKGKIPDCFVLRIVQYDPVLVSEVKNSPSRFFQPESKTWSLPAQKNFEWLPRFLASKPVGFFSVSEEAKKALADIEISLNESRKIIELSKKSDSSLVISGLNYTPYPFQLAGVEYAIKQGNCLIGDEMGLGKTIQGIAWAMAKQAFPLLIVCPASLKLNWAREVAKWIGKESTIANGKALGQGAEVVVINYDILSKRKEDLLAYGFKGLILDESHYIKSGKSVRSKTALEIAEVIPNRLCLTGTPVLNRPIELLTQLCLLGRIDEFGGRYAFMKRYCNAHRTRFGLDCKGASNLAELNDKLRATCMVRRLKKDVLSELPNKIIEKVSVELSNREEYREAQIRTASELKALLSEEKEVKIQGGNTGKLQAEKLVKIELLKQICSKGKLQEQFAWIENFLESSTGKLVVFATHKETIQAITEKFSCNAITGETEIENRQKFVDDFQLNENTRIIALNLQAGGVGITLTAASTLCFLELGWNPGQHSQAEDRIHRIGQKSGCQIFYLNGADTIDEWIDALIEKKRIVLNAAVDGSAFDTEQFSILDELVEMLVSRI